MPDENMASRGFHLIRKKNMPQMDESVNNYMRNIFRYSSLVQNMAYSRAIAGF